MSAPDVRISVVIASYNGAQHILEQLTSIAGQTLAPLEIILSDDGSGDGTVSRVREFASDSAVPVVIIENEQRLGYPDNFLQAALHARGELIAFADQDDVWLPQKLGYAAAAFRDPSVMQWLHESYIVDEQLRPWPDRGFHTGLAKRAGRADPFQPLHGSHSVFRADLLRFMPPVNRPASVYGPHPAEHDEWIKFAALVFGRVGWQPRRLMLYRRHQAALTRWAPIPSRRDVLRGLDPDRDVNVIRAALERGQYLERRADAPECDGVRQQLLAAARQYRQLVPILERRVATRRGASRGARSRSFLLALVRLDYRRHRRGGLGTWALVQDLHSVIVPGGGSGA
jgi:hypothetical protein